MSTSQISLLCSIVLCLLGVTGCSDISVPSDANQADNQVSAGGDELRKAVDTFYSAWYDSDWDVYYSYYADDVVFIDSSGKHMSLQEYEANAAQEAEAVGAPSFDDARANLVPTVRVSPTGNAGVAYWTFPFEYQTDDGVRTTIEYAESDVWWRVNGEWKITLVHYHALSNDDLQN